MAEALVELGQVYVRSDRIVGREFMGEFILVPLAGTTANLTSIFATNQVGSFIWRHCTGDKNGQQIVTAMLEEFDTSPEQAEKDYCIFVQQLVSVGP